MIAEASDEGAPENPHLAPVFHAQKQVDEEDQDPHGAGVEAVQGPDDQGDQAQGQILDLNLARTTAGSISRGWPGLFRGGATLRGGHAGGHHIGGLAARAPSGRPRSMAAPVLASSSQPMTYCSPTTVKGTPETSARSSSPTFLNNSRLSRDSVSSKVIILIA